MELLLLSGFNNYFNRHIIRYDDLQDYISHSKSAFQLADINFNPNDNVQTKIILNSTLDNADYLVAYEKNDTYTSRWFILSNVRQRNGQYELSLKRDVIADNINELLTSPVYVHKGMVEEGNPLILNSEGMSFNQIKTSETLLQDKTKSAWLVGYISKNCPAYSITTSSQETILEHYTMSEIATAMGTTEEILSSLVNIGLANNIPTYFTEVLQIAFSVYFGSFEGAIPTTEWVKFLFAPNVEQLNNLAQDYTVSLEDYNFALYKYIGTTSSYIRTSYNNFATATINNKSSLISALPSYANRSYYLTSSQLEILQAYTDKPILYNGVYYDLNITRKSHKYYTHINKQLPSGYSVLDTIVNTNNTPLNNGRITLRTKDAEVYIHLVERDTQTSPSTFKVDIATSRATCKNQVYDMFALPFSNLKFYDETNSAMLSGISSEQALKLAIEVARELDANLYDLQLLPYCPFLNTVSYDDENEAIVINTDNTQGQDYSFITRTTPLSTLTHNDSIDNTGWTTTTIDHPHLGRVKQATKTITVLPTTNYALTSASFVLSSSALLNGWGKLGVLVSGNNVIINCWNSNTDIQTLPSGTLTWKENPTIDTTNASVLYWCSSATFQTQLPYKFEIEESRKLDSQCNMYRLVSPNYQGSFEFNVAKNGTSVDYFTAYCTYKPYTPFIKIEPQFSDLYGTNFNDNRGLICGGDFSIPRFTDRWETYELNNKNYQNIFNRDVANLDFNNQIAMRNQIVGATTGVISDTVKGAGTGALIGGGWGALIGGIVGGATSTIGAVYDTTTLQREQHENRSLAIDKYNFSLGNIKALPYTLTKVGAFDISSKLFPFVEFYTCTDEEKQMLRDKITYESMTLFKIDYLGNYWGKYDTRRYFKGELIRNLEIAIPTNMFNEIYNELLKGVYI